jgi:hypothetical protein
VLAQKSNDYFRVHALDWIAPDHLLNCKTREQLGELHDHAHTLVMCLARKRTLEINTVLLRSLCDPAKLKVYVRILGVPEVYSHVYIPQDRLTPVIAPCPPFDDIEWLDTLRAQPETRLEKMNRE